MSGMRTRLAPVEVVLTTPADDDEVWHAVCHCTDDRFAACGLDVADSPWAKPDEEPCPLCFLAWPDEAPTCPWGCACDEECGPA